MPRTQLKLEIELTHGKAKHDENKPYLVKLVFRHHRVNTKTAVDIDANSIGETVSFRAIVRKAVTAAA